MKKGISSINATMLAVWCLSVSPLHAQDIREGGCEALADAVAVGIGDIVAAGGSARPASGTLQPRPVNGKYRQSCGRTAAVASAAFSKALASYNLNVNWSEHYPIAPGDYCHSADLSRCYPGTPSIAPAASDRTLFVRRAWQGVSAGIRQQMPFGTASDISYFQAPELATTLRISLSATVDRPQKRFDRLQAESFR
jgi:hypothetical protein